MSTKGVILFSQYSKFDWVYMFIMVIYMAQATPETSRMIGTLSGNPIPLLLPIILTYILCINHPISFNNKKFYFVLTLYGIWASSSLIKYGTFSTEELSYHFFMVYAITIAYIHNQIFGYKLVSIYEKIIVLLCKISIIGWGIAVFLPSSASFFHLFPETRYGNHVLYIFNWMDPAKGQIYSGLLRNAGCSWEPGRFAIMITLAIYCNLCQNSIKFKDNKNIIWLLLALVTTQSTTGYTIALVIYSIFLIKKFNAKYVFTFIFIITPIFYGLIQLDFMGDKVKTKIIEAQDVSRLNKSFEWHEGQNEKGEYLGSIDRFDAFVFEWMNIVHDPILGYGRNVEHSYFYNYITSNYVLANGLMKILGMYGIPLGLYFFYILFCSSLTIAKRSSQKKALGLMILFCLSSISYNIFTVPVFTSFWFYAFLGKYRIKRSSKEAFIKLKTQPIQ